MWTGWCLRGFVEVKYIVQTWSLSLKQNEFLSSTISIMQIDGDGAK